METEATELIVGVIVVLTLFSVTEVCYMLVCIVDEFWCTTQEGTRSVCLHILLTFEIPTIC